LKSLVCLFTPLIGLVVLASCNSLPTESPETSQPTTVGCATLSQGLEKDTCLHDAINLLPATEIDQVLEAAQSIQDSMIQGAAVSSWVAEHSTEIPRQKGETLCKLLSGRDWSYCLRRLSSPHLKR